MLTLYIWMRKVAWSKSIIHLCVNSNVNAQERRILKYGVFEREVTALFPLLRIRCCRCFTVKQLFERQHKTLLKMDGEMRQYLSLYLPFAFSETLCINWKKKLNTRKCLVNCQYYSIRVAVLKWRVHPRNTITLRQSIATQNKPFDVLVVVYVSCLFGKRHIQLLFSKQARDIYNYCLPNRQETYTTTRTSKENCTERMQPSGTIRYADKSHTDKTNPLC